MKLLLAGLSLAVLVGAGPAVAQTEMDHRVQRAWDNVFNPPPPGDPRTNFERRRDRVRYDEQRRAQADRAQWCRRHAGADGCGREYGERYYNR